MGINGDLYLAAINPYWGLMGLIEDLKYPLIPMVNMEDLKYLLISIYPH